MDVTCQVGMEMLWECAEISNISLGRQSLCDVGIYLAGISFWLVREEYMTHLTHAKVYISVMTVQQA